MGKRIADIHRRAMASQEGNQRYLEALTPNDASTTLKVTLAEICKPITRKGRRVRALRPWDMSEMRLLAAIMSGYHLIHGIRKRDLVHELDPGWKEHSKQRRKAAARIRCQMRILRAHGIVKKVAKTPRHLLTEKGKRILSPLLSAQEAPLSLFVAGAA